MNKGERFVEALKKLAIRSQKDDEFGKVSGEDTLLMWRDGEVVDFERF